MLEVWVPVHTARWGGGLACRSTCPSAVLIVFVRRANLSQDLEVQNDNLVRCVGQGLQQNRENVVHQFHHLESVITNENMEGNMKCLRRHYKLIDQCCDFGTEIHFCRMGENELCNVLITCTGGQGQKSERGVGFLS